MSEAIDYYALPEQPARNLTPVPARGLIEISNVSKFFGKHKALDDVSLTLQPGTVTVILGPSGSGKSTLLRAINHLERVDEGFIRIDGDYVGYRRKGNRLYELKEKAILRQRINVGYVFQNFNLFPHLTVLENIIEAPVVHKIHSRERAKAVAYELLDTVGLRHKADAYPRHLSGGQQQRIAIARALALNPKVVIADEAVSALDVSIQAQIVNLLLDLQREFGIAFLFISHDMAVVERISHRVAVMYLGQIVEIGPRQAVFDNPQHPYTRKLMAAVPVADPAHAHKRQPLPADEIPSPVRALGDEPVTAPLVQVGAGHFVARHPIAGAF
ncbi:ATP-binding cassette domain-containing protein [Serratia marcescens]|nr:ATP-binding cassette domain-containing protein [Serratia marcescens]RTF91141.1 ATP-binding cassette domain-containing protein [Serratia marcescens]RTG32940.1 ATP-binding cassette domain-containing protein [Serratia marcescens]